MPEGPHQPPGTNETLQQHRNANSSIQKPPQQRFVFTPDLRGAQECFIGLSVTNVLQEETSKNIHFLHQTLNALLALKGSKYLTLRGFQEWLIPKQVLG